jgi:hypothetical protein
MAVPFSPGNLAAGVLQGRLRKASTALLFRVQQEALKSISRQAIAGAGAGTAAMIALVGEGVTDERKRELANSIIATRVRQAILSGYDLEVAARKNRNPAYALRRNRLTGKLRDALADMSLYQAGPKEIRILNTAMLTKEAAHWARLQFGVEGPDVAIGRSPEVSFTLFGQKYDIGFNEGPRPGYVLPHGIWMDGGGVKKGERTSGIQVPYSKSQKGAHAFFPSNVAKSASAFGAASLRAGGIEPRYYLEHGLRAFGREFRSQYNRLVQEAIDGADGKKTQNAVRSAVQSALGGGRVNFQSLKVRVTD